MDQEVILPIISAVATVAFLGLWSKAKRRLNSHVDQSKRDADMHREAISKLERNVAEMKAKYGPIIVLEDEVAKLQRRPTASGRA